MPVYSFSQIRVFEQCPLKYRYQYIEKIRTEQEPQSPHMLLGSAVHYALEYLYKQLNQFQSPSKEQLLAVFHTYWQQEIDYTTIVFHEDTPESLFLRRGETYISAYYDHHTPFDAVQVVLTEGKIVFSLDESGSLKFRGVIDRLDKEGTTFIINDYKTNKHLPEEDKQQYQEQLTLYGLGVQQKYGKYYETLKARLYYLHFDLVDEWEIDDTLMQGVVDKYTSIVKTIEDKRFHYNMGDSSRFPAVENSGCTWCSYQSICPLWAHMSMEDEVLLGDKTVKGLVDEYAQVSKQMTALDKQKKMLKDALQQYIQQKKLKKLFGDEYQLSVTPGVHYSIKEKEKLESYLEEKGVLDMYKQLDRNAVTRGIKEEDLDIGEIQDMLQVNESYTLRVAKKKE